MPKVLNKHHLKDGKIPENAVYIGRGSKWGNPWTHIPNGTKAKYITPDRETAIECYIDMFCHSPQMMYEAYDELEGKDLVCYCAPKACHGDFLLEFVNGKQKDE